MVEEPKKILKGGKEEKGRENKVDWGYAKTVQLRTLEQLIISEIIRKMFVRYGFGLTIAAGQLRFKTNHLKADQPYFL